MFVGKQIHKYTVYQWRKNGLNTYLEVTLGEDFKTVESWRAWTSLECP